MPVAQQHHHNCSTWQSFSLQGRVGRSEGRPVSHSSPVGHSWDRRLSTESYLSWVPQLPRNVLGWKPGLNKSVSRAWLPNIFVHMLKHFSSAMWKVRTISYSTNPCLGLSFFIQADLLLQFSFPIWLLSLTPKWGPVSVTFQTSDSLQPIHFKHLP